MLAITKSISLVGLTGHLIDVEADIGNGVLKSVVFGVAVTFIALYQGYVAAATPEGVARATTRTVVIGSLMVLWLDFLLTALMFS